MFGQTSAVACTCFNRDLRVILHTIPFRFGVTTSSGSNSAVPSAYLQSPDANRSATNTLNVMRV